MREKMRRDHLWVLGLNIGLHDASAALLCNGELIAMAEQERFSRKKRATGEAPIEALQFCLDLAGIELQDLAAIGLGSDMRLLDQWHGLTPEEIKQRPRLDDPARLFPKAVFEYELLPQLIPIRHHLAHAASAFWVSGFEEAAILVVDNRGEHTSTTLAYGTEQGIVFLEEYGVAQSLGIYYRTAAQYAGLCGKHREVGKFMGLASYGRPNQTVPLTWDKHGLQLVGLEELPALRGIELPPYRTQQLMQYFQAHCFPFAQGDGREVMAYAHFAASVQASLEQALLGLCQRLKRLTSSNNLALAGGVALNCTANGTIASSGLFEGLFVQPAAHDSGVALGAALEVTRQLMPAGRLPYFVMRHAYWGPEYSQQQITTALKRHALAFQELDEDELIATVARQLAAGKIIGWFQGRAEIGPRALGARSLLGNPMHRETLIRLNTIKSREMWRPLAPSIREERFSDFFVFPHSSPFMIVANQVRAERQRDIPAVVHVDGSARPQSVSFQTNPRYWKLIYAFEKLTGIPVLVNTSFNVDAEPIVHSPDDAIRDFLNTEIDCLVIGNAVAFKAAALPAAAYPTDRQAGSTHIRQGAEQF